MKERPILFSAQMVQAILAGHKSETRRVMKIQPPEDCERIIVGNYHPTIIDRHGDEQPGTEIFGAYSTDGDWGLRSPYGQPGDSLWVRETWARDDETGEILFRAADNESVREWNQQRAETGHPKYRWKPSIFMPRWASRITLEITGVRADRLQDISRGDAMDEGCPFPNRAYGDDPRQWYAGLWDTINGRGSWDKNPFVWCIEFRVITP